VISAKTPQRGLALFQAHQAKIDLVAIDMTVPLASNLDLAADLERLRPGLPILYLVGAERSIARCSIEAQAPHSVLTTPFTEQQLLDRAGRLLKIEIAARRAPEAQQWDRLIAASAPVLSGAGILHVYGLRQAPLAADHISILRAGAIDHSVRPTNCDEAPYSVAVHAKDAARARFLLTKASGSRQLVSAA